MLGAARTCRAWAFLLGSPEGWSPPVWSALHLGRPLPTWAWGARRPQVHACVFDAPSTAYSPQCFYREKGPFLEKSYQDKISHILCTACGAVFRQCDEHGRMHAGLFQCAACGGGPTLCALDSGYNWCATDTVKWHGFSFALPVSIVHSMLTTRVATDAADWGTRGVTFIDDDNNGAWMYVDSDPVVMLRARLYGLEEPDPKVVRCGNCKRMAVKYGDIYLCGKCGRYTYHSNPSEWHMAIRCNYCTVQRLLPTSLRCDSCDTQCCLHCLVDSREWTSPSIQLGWVAGQLVLSCDECGPKYT